MEAGAPRQGWARLSLCRLQPGDLAEVFLDRRLEVGHVFAQKGDVADELLRLLRVPSGQSHLRGLGLIHLPLAGLIQLAEDGGPEPFTFAVSRRGRRNRRRMRQGSTAANPTIACPGCPGTMT